VWTSRNLDTDQILAIFIRDAWMGRFGRGLRDPARQLFRKDLADLDYPEAALLVAIYRNPETYDPVRRPKQAMERRNHFLEELSRAGILSETELTRAKAAPLGIRIASS
jgi:penicillin-binding protein 1A